jgi:hypothetical protein
MRAHDMSAYAKSSTAAAVRCLHTADPGGPAQENEFFDVQVASWWDSKNEGASKPENVFFLIQRKEY